MENIREMRLLTNPITTMSMIAVIVDGSTLIGLRPQDSVDRLAECLASLHRQRGGPLLRAEIRLVSSRVLTNRVVHESSAAGSLHSQQQRDRTDE
jgi:hypothetical protein